MLEMIKLPVDDLKIGMYVSSLDRPWLETPFLLQGFALESLEDIERLQKHCAWVFIDTRKSVVVESLPSSASKRGSRQTIKELFSNRALVTYHDAGSWDEEFPRAKAAVDVLSRGINELFEDLRQGDPLDLGRIKKSVDPMIESVSRNPDACIWLARLKQEDAYTYQHSLGASIWAVALGRQLGLPRKDLRSLAMGGLLFDIGKLGVDSQLLQATRALTDEEFQQVRNHVTLGVDMLGGSPLLNQDIMDMVAHHHERHDGSGYPEGLKGNNIPIFARIAAIVDCYDAITSHRSYARAMPPSHAIKMLYEWKDIDFQAELVEAFIQAIGIYPAGSLVELSTGEVAVVIAEYRSRRLRPKVMVLLDTSKKPLTDVITLDLLEGADEADGVRIDIVGSLEPDAYGIDMAAIQL